MFLVCGEFRLPVSSPKSVPIERAESQAGVSFAVPGLGPGGRCALCCIGCPATARAAVPGLYLYELSSRGVEIPYTPCRLDSLFRAVFFSKSNIGRSAMRMLWLFGVAAVLFVSMPTSQADARWVCRASSSTGSWGMGWHNSSRSYARGRALLECAARTPRNRTCYIRSCRRR